MKAALGYLLLLLAQEKRKLAWNAIARAFDKAPVREIQHDRRAVIKSKT